MMMMMMMMLMTVMMMIIDEDDDGLKRPDGNILFSLPDEFYAGEIDARIKMNWIAEKYHYFNEILSILAL